MSSDLFETLPSQNSPPINPKAGFKYIYQWTDDKARTTGELDFKLKIKILVDHHLNITLTTFFIYLFLFCLTTSVTDKFVVVVVSNFLSNFCPALRHNLVIYLSGDRRR